MNRCAECGREREKPAPPRLPQGWKRKGEAVYCKDCWRKHYILRAVSMRVASPLDCEWKELDDSLRLMWAQTTAASNWMMTELYARDLRREKDQTKMPPMPSVYLYPETRKRFPDLPAQTVAALEQATQRKYRARRYELIWTSFSSLPVYRYPVPFPIHNQSWSVESEGEARVVSARIGDRRLRLRLKQGPEYHRQMHSVDQMISGAAVRGEMALYRQGTGPIMCKMVAWLPKPESLDQRSGTLIVRTAKDSLLVALNAKDEKLWTYNGDHLRRWGSEHRTQLQRWSEDAKAENRPVPTFAQRRESSAGKYRHRLNSAIHEISAQLAGYATRRRFASVRYDDSVKEFAGPAFPYFSLRLLIEQKLDAAGIPCEILSATEAEGQEAGREE